MPAALVTNFASSAGASSHSIPLSGKSTARDLLALIISPTTPTLPANWIEEESGTGGGGAFLVRLWHLPAYLNTSSVTSLTVALSASSSLAAVVWEDDVDPDAPNLYFGLQASNSPNASSPALWGTGAHTFATHDEAFAFFLAISSGGDDLGAFDLASYDTSFVDFGDSGKGLGNQQSRVWIATRASFSVTADGVTATANGVRPPPGSGLGGGSSGMLAYDTGAPLPPTAVLARSPTSLTLNYEVGADAPSATVLIENNGGGGTIDWSIASSAPWLSFSSTSGTGVAPGVPASVTAIVDPTGLAVGSHTGVITITAGGVAGSPQTIPVTLTVIAQSLDYAPQDNVRLWRPSGSSWRRIRDLGEFHTSPEMHGARGDGLHITDAATTVDTPLLDSPAGPFRSTDVGKWVNVRGAGLTSQGGSMSAQIVSVTSSTRVELDRNAAASVSGQVAVYGTDDTQAWRDALDYLIDLGISKTSFLGKLIPSPRHYIIAGAPVLGGATMGNSQIPLQYIDNTGPQFALSIEGPGDGSGFYHWHQKYIRGGAVLHSILLGQAIDTTYSVPSVLGGPTSLPAEGDATTPFSNMLVNISGIKVVCPRNPSYIGIDLLKCGQANIGTLSINADGTPGPGGTLEGSATNDQALALRMPGFQNNDNTNVFSFGSEGFFYGIQISDHFTAQRLAIIYADTALIVTPGGGPEHGASIVYMSVEATNNGIQSFGGAGGLYSMKISRMDIEVSGSGHTVVDPNNTLDGVLHYSHNGLVSPTVVGAANLKIIDDHKHAGAVTAPTYTTSSLVNPFWRDAVVHLGSGVTAVSVDGQSKAIPSGGGGMVVVPSGKAIQATGAGSWSWTLL